MKKIFSLLLLYFCMATTIYAQKLNVPAAVTKTFTAKYPGAMNVKWGKESAKEYEAEFKLNDVNVSANFATDGNWVETETVIKLEALPAAVVASIKKNYPGAAITLAEKLEEPGDKVQYETTFKVKGKKKTVEMNADGSFVK